MFYIYKITNKINGKIYIGKTNDPYQRMHSHLSVARNGATNSFYQDTGKYNYIHRAITKYGEDNFSFP
jgi:predicted GIY-YIG superfamily endonuclease